MPAEPAASHTGTATILFTDLVGSTRLRAGLGEERAETLSSVETSPGLKEIYAIAGLG